MIKPVTKDMPVNPSFKSRPSFSKPQGKTPRTQHKTPSSFVRSKGLSSSMKPSGSGIWLWGLHAVKAALSNPQRHCHTLLTTSPLGEEFTTLTSLHPHLQTKHILRHELDTLLPQALHQGMALQVSALPHLSLQDFCGKNPHAKRLVVLDHITDPHNLGAIMRSARAFGFDALVLTLRHSPPLEGVVAKSASGALEKIPVVWTTNLVQGLELLKKEGFWCLGLSEKGIQPLSQVKLPERLALVLGAEGKGLRPLTQERCDILASLPTSPEFPTLNVSAAAAVAFFCTASRI